MKFCDANLWFLRLTSPSPTVALSMAAYNELCGSTLLFPEPELSNTKRKNYRVFKLHDLYIKSYSRALFFLRILF